MPAKKKRKCRNSYAAVNGSKTFKSVYAQLQSAAARSGGSYAEGSRRAAQFARARAIAAGAKVRRVCRMENRGKR